LRDSIKKEYWWVSAGEVENESESPFIAMKYNSTFRDYSKLAKASLELVSHARGENRSLTREQDVTLVGLRKVQMANLE
jgi:hypothetical protein